MRVFAKKIQFMQRLDTIYYVFCVQQEPSIKTKNREYKNRSIKKITNFIYICGLVLSDSRHTHKICDVKNIMRSSAAHIFNILIRVLES